MKDKAKVISIEGEFSRVEVQCLFTACERCSARNLCRGDDPDSRLLLVKNPLGAKPGDMVTIEVPEDSYTRSLISIFGFLLLSSLLGMGLGFLSSRLVVFSPEILSIAGLLSGLFICGFLLLNRFRKKNLLTLYPVIISILNKGEDNG